MASDYFLSRDFRSATWAVHFVETYLKRVHKLPIASVHAMDSDQLRIAIRQDSGPRKVLHFDLPSTAQHFGEADYASVVSRALDDFARYARVEPTRAFRNRKRERRWPLAARKWLGG